MKSSSKILIGGVSIGVILIVVGFLLSISCYDRGLTTTEPGPSGGWQVTHESDIVYPYRGWGMLLIFFSFIFFIATGISAAVKSGKEKREQTISSAPVQQTPPQSAPQQQIPQPQPAQATQTYQQPLPPVQPPASEATQLQYCPTCGKKIQPGWTVCGYCGRRLGG